MLWVGVEHDDFAQVATEIRQIFDDRLIVIPGRIAEEFVEDINHVRVEFINDGNGGICWLRCEENDLIELG